MQYTDPFGLTKEECDAFSELIDLGINSMPEDPDHDDDVMLWGGCGLSKIIEAQEAGEKGVAVESSGANPFELDQNEINTLEENLPGRRGVCAQASQVGKAVFGACSGCPDQNRTGV